MVFMACEMLHKMPYFILEDKYQVTEGKRCLEIKSGLSYNISLNVTSEHIGHYCVPLAFQFMFKDEKKPFHILRWIRLSCIDDIALSLRPIEPYKPVNSAVILPPATHIVKGIRPEKNKLNSLEEIIRLNDYSVPIQLKEIVQNKMKKWDSMDKEMEKLLNSVRELLNSGVQKDTYSSFFETLLYLEEIQMEIDIRKYDMFNTTMKFDSLSGKFHLEVPGLMENRPSLLKGDTLYVRLSNCKKSEIIEYVGRVLQVKLNTVTLGFPNYVKKIFLNGIKVDVRFSFNRSSLKHMHRALKFFDTIDIKPLLFPTVETAATCKLRNVKNFIFFNKNIEKNHEQATAVKQIVLGSSRLAPYLLFGPPGTGKTVTLVEAIKQLWKLDKDTKILVCAPSNSAADLLTERIIEHVPYRQVFRMFAVSRSLDTIPEKIKKCSNINNGDFYYPSRNNLMKYQIIVTTLVTAGRLVSADFHLNHFTHIFIDEAGNSKEPELIIPVSGLIQSSVNNLHSGHLIFAGDPKQLGPILRSPEAIKYGLDLSLLERLMNIKEVYGRKEDNLYDNRVLTKLLKNYRSHPAILKLPNELFYDNELQPCADINERNLFCSWKQLPVPGFPIIFHGVIGQDQREQKSPSYFNPEEVSVVVNYVKMLLDVKKNFGITAKDIGIISPYRRQVEKIRMKLNNIACCNNITVGSVEEFQGQERKVIIISTVRSNPNLLDLDHKFKLGFLRNPKRFNVAITRAKALLIVIGNPLILSKDYHWNSILKYCYGNKSYKGAPFVSTNEEIDDIIERMTYLEIVDNENNKNEIPISQKTLQEEPQWGDDI